MIRGQPDDPNSINVIGDTAAAILLFEAMLSHCPNAEELRETFNMPERPGDKPDTIVTVELKVNDVVVPFRSTLESAWERMSESFEEATLRKAKELVTRARFDDVHGVLDRMYLELEGHAWEVERRLKQVLAEDA